MKERREKGDGVGEELGKGDGKSESEGEEGKGVGRNSRGAEEKWE